MPYYEFDPVKSLEGKTKIPKSLIDIPQIIAERQSRKLGGRFLQADSEDKKILDFFKEFGEVNRFHELIVTIEELCSLFGQVIICIDKYEDSVPLVSFTDPYMLSRVGKFHFQEKVASVYKYIVRDTKSFPVYEEWTEKKVKRIGYQPDSDIQVDSLRAPVREIKDKQVIKVEEKYHNLGCLPIVELRNKQKGVYELQSPYNGKPQLATWYPVRGMIKFAYHTLRQIWKNMILVKPKIIGEFYGQDMTRFANSSNEMADVLGDMFLSLKHGTAGEGTPNLEILQGDMKIKEWFDGFQTQLDLILTSCGLPPHNEAQVEQTATEIKAKGQSTTETVRLLKQLRLDQMMRIHDKALIIHGLGDGKGERPYALSMPEEETEGNDKQKIEEAKMRIEANLSNYITEIAIMNNVNKQEAEAILKENIKINSEVFEQTKSMMLEEDSQDSESNNKGEENKEE